MNEFVGKMSLQDKIAELESQDCGIGEAPARNGHHEDDDPHDDRFD